MEDIAHRAIIGKPPLAYSDPARSPWAVAAASMRACPGASHALPEWTSLSSAACSVADSCFVLGRERHQRLLRYDCWSSIPVVSPSTCGTLATRRRRQCAESAPHVKGGTIRITGLAACRSRVRLTQGSCDPPAGGSFGESASRESPRRCSPSSLTSRSASARPSASGSVAATIASRSSLRGFRRHGARRAPPRKRPLPARCTRRSGSRCDLRPRSKQRRRLATRPCVTYGVCTSSSVPSGSASLPEEHHHP
jgi:hypothetical protein